MGNSEISLEDEGRLNNCEGYPNAYKKKIRFCERKVMNIGH